MVLYLILVVALVGITLAFSTKIVKEQKRVSALEAEINSIKTKIASLEKEDTMVLVDGLNAFKYDAKTKTTIVAGNLKVSGSVSAGEISTN